MIAFSAVSELEHLLTIPPPSQNNNVPANNPIAVAHAVLEAIREAGDEQCLFLRSIMELQGQGRIAQKEELFFHCVTGCRQVVLWQWNKTYSARFQRALRDYFMMLGHELSRATIGGGGGGGGGESSSSRTCRLACYTSAVAFWKRGWTNQGEGHLNNNNIVALRPIEESLLKDLQASLPAPVLNDQNDLSHYLESLFQQIPELAATFSLILVGEFSGKSAVAYRLPLEFHKQAHRSFEKTALFPILQMSMKALSQAVAALSRSHSQGINGSDTSIINTLRIMETTTKAIVELTIDVIGWEFGMTAWDTGSLGASSSSMSRTSVIRPPYEWKQVLVQPDFVRATFHVHHLIVSNQQQEHHHHHHHGSQTSSTGARLAQSLRQLLLQLASLSGPMFSHPSERAQFASYLTEGSLQLLELCNNQSRKVEECPELLDTLQIISKVIANFRLTTLVELPTLLPLLKGVTYTANKILTDQVRECEQEGGDLDGMEHREWREEAMSLLLDCAVLLCGDPWLLYSGTEERRKHAQLSLSGVLGPLYEGFVRCRTKMAAMEEHYNVSVNADLDDNEEIVETDLEEEICQVSVVGRLNLSAAISCLSNLFGQTVPSLQSMWDGSGEVTPQTAALLEESRLLTMYVCQLLTDDNKGEAPAIPDAIVIACRENASLTGEISSAVQALLNFAESQVQKLAANSSNHRLSPMLAKSFLWFLNRWAPAYIYPTDYGSSNSSNNICLEWSSPEKAQQGVTFCITVCLHYQCYWPHEPLVQESVGQLLLSLAKRKGEIRSAMVASPAFHQMVRFHCLTAGVRHSASHEEFDSAIRSKVAGANSLPALDMVWGYQRLPYQDKARYLTAILVTCSDTKNEASNTMFSDSLKAVHDAFTMYIQAVSTKQVGPDDINAREMACLCVEMFCGVVLASEMSDPERIPLFVTPYLPQLASLMVYYADNLTIAETLLRFFRDYAINFIVALNCEQSLALFNSAAEVLKNYSVNHCEKRVIRKRSVAEAEAEEEQEYSDILCAIQLLINLSAKDFIDACSSEQAVNTSQVTDMIFFGLQQIIPLMTQGLLQFPTLCQQFFDLVGFMMDTYPEKVCALPYDLFNSLLESLLFGMSHHNTSVSNCSLHGIASIAKEHLEAQVLRVHLAQHPDILDRIVRRLLSEVVFQNVVVDRVEAAGMALLPLAAVDVNRFASIVHELSAQVPHEQQRLRLQAAFQKLIRPEALVKVSEGGYEGRMNRSRFKKDFEEFVNEVHSFLVIR